MIVACGGEAARGTPSPAGRVVQFRAAKRARRYQSPCHQHLAVRQQRRRVTVACGGEAARGTPSPAGRVVQFRAAKSAAVISPCHQHLAVGQQRRRVNVRAVVRLPVLLNVNGASAGERLWNDAGPAITRSLPPAATGLMAALNPLVAGVALKLEATKTAEIDSRASERATWSAQARVELFRCFFIELFRLNCINCNPVPRRTGNHLDEAL